MKILKYKYKLRPEIPVMFRYRDSHWYTTAILDSGSDITYLPYDMARMMLKMPLRSQPETIDAAGGKDFRGIPQRVTLCVLNEEGKEVFSFPRTKVYVADRHYDNDHTVLGMESFFGRFDVTISAKRKELVLKQVQP
jgi:hypothetical protein